MKAPEKSERKELTGRWVCTADSKHFQKMRKNDLKLQKMAAKIHTKKERHEVNVYFAAMEKELSMKKKSKVKGSKNKTHKDSPKQVFDIENNQLKMEDF